MVCKKDVLLWFKDLESYNRIDIMYQLLNMCVPFEIRFLGSCIEEIGKHSYQELRGSAITANDLEKLSKDTSLLQGLVDEGVRHRVLIYLSLLSSRNFKCASWYYKTLLKTEWVESCVLNKMCDANENLENEFLLLFTLALYHPAFTFEQKLFFGHILSSVLDQRDCKKQLGKPNYPPGFGYTSIQKLITHPEPHAVPMKPTINQGDAGFHQTHPQNMLPIDLTHMWQRAGFTGQMSGAPEMPPFSAPTASPIVSQSTSPNQSRPASPHKLYLVRSVPGLQQPNQLIEVLPACTASVSVDQLSHSNLLPFNSELRNKEEDMNHIPDDKLREAPWVTSLGCLEIKPPNGIRLPPYHQVPSHSFVDQMHGLSLERDGTLQYSSSTSSSNNSLNPTPPDTPTTTPPSVPNHGPGRGDSKPRMNGVPQFINMVPASMNTGPPLCETTPPPPHPHAPNAINNCSVPYTAYPNRSVLQFPPSYRPHFSVPFTYPPDVYTIPNPYIPFIFSSTPSQVSPSNPNCYNCGAVGHMGADCTGQTIEEITQKKAYTLDYNSPPLSDIDK